MSDIISVVFIFAVVIICLKSIFKGSPHGQGSPEPYKPPKIPLYKKRNTVMNASEASFFTMLRTAIADEYPIFSKMRIADILEAVDGPGYYQRRNMILPKHVDFLICDKNFTPLLAIELDGASHRNYDRVERDRIVDAIFADAGVKLMHVIVGHSFANAIADIKETITPSAATTLAVTI